MKIPDPYFNGGLGQQVAPVNQVARPQGLVMPDNRGGEAIGRAIGNLGQAIQENYNKITNEALQKEQESERELKRLEEKNILAAAEVSVVANQSKLMSIMADINKQDLLPSEKRALFKEKAEEEKQLILDAIPSNVHHAVVPALARQHFAVSDILNKELIKQQQDVVKSHLVKAVEELQRSPLPLAEKLELVSDLDWQESGYSATDAEKEIQAFREGATGVEVDYRIHNTPPKEVLRELSAQDENGRYLNYSYLEPKTRETKIMTVKGMLEQQRQDAEREKEKQKTAARQTATELMTEYKDKVNSGWMPATADDHQFVATVKQYSSLSPSLSRQFTETKTKMGDLTFRTELRTKDPLGTAAAERGVILPGINLSSPTTLPQQFATRREVARQLGIKAVLKGEEAKVFSSYLETLDARTQTKTVQGIYDQLGKVEGAATFSMVAEQIRHSDPGKAVFFKLAAKGDFDNARNYMDGRAFVSGEKKDLIQEGADKMLKGSLKTALDKKLGTALLAMPESRNATTEAVAYAYLGAAKKNNLPLDTLDTKLLDKVSKSIIGETTMTGSRWGSNKTTIIPAGMNEDKFLNSIKAITAKDIASRGGVDGMTDEQAAEVVKKVAWHEIGNGYGFYKDGAQLYTKKGQPFIWRFDQ